MIEVVEFCFVMFPFLGGGGVRKILVGSVHTLVSLVLMVEHVKVCQHFGLSYAMQTSVQAYSTWKLLKVAVRLWGGVQRLVK